MPECASCKQARLANQWCESSRVGYVAGVPIRQRMLFEALDAHGHELDIVNVKCPSCRDAIARDGFCETCRIGWVKKLAYFSRLTYHLARGKACDPAALTCATCRKNAATHGWCAACGIGMIGNVAVTDRTDFEGGCRGFDLMSAAVAASGRCEACALAILNDEPCFYCKITYRDGKPVPKAAAAQAP